MSGRSTGLDHGNKSDRHWAGTTQTTHDANEMSQLLEDVYVIRHPMVAPKASGINVWLAKLRNRYILPSSMRGLVFDASSNPKSMYISNLKI